MDVTREVEERGDPGALEEGQLGGEEEPASPPMRPSDDLLQEGADFIQLDRTLHGFPLPQSQLSINMKSQTLFRCKNE